LQILDFRPFDFAQDRFGLKPKTRPEFANLLGSGFPAAFVAPTVAGQQRTSRLTLPATHFRFNAKSAIGNPKMMAERRAGE
jgi:hypothetical protein